MYLSSCFALDDGLSKRLSLNVEYFLRFVLPCRLGVSIFLLAPCSMGEGDCVGFVVELILTKFVDGILLLLLLPNVLNE